MTQFELGNSLARIFLAHIILAVTVLGGCAPVVIYQPPEARSEVPQGQMPISLNKLGVENHKRLTEPLAYPGPSEPSYVPPDGMPLNEEWDWNAESGAPPKLCLALSGGGLRSATFNLGVLKGLHAAGIWQNVDVASSVSGGGYILSWYIAQKYHAYQAQKQSTQAKVIDDAALFEIEGDYQKHLRDNSNFYSAANGTVPLALAIFPGVPLNLLANGIFGLHMNTSMLYNDYAERLRQVYHADPKNLNTPSGIDILELEKFMRETKMRRDVRPPIFVINTSALLDEAAGPQASLLQNVVFEFTPFQYGSAALGRYRYRAAPLDANALAIQRQWDLHELAAFSGAALDFNQFIAHPSSRQLATVINVDLGRYIPNPRLARTPEQLAWWLMPVAHIFGRPHYGRNADGTHIYLTDGGHTENLGAFSLVRRLCQEIIIVDAEEDPHYTYGAYYKLKQALAREMSATLQIDAIEKRRDKLCKGQIVCPDPDVKSLPHKQPAWEEAANNPVTTGSISHLPYCRPRDQSCDSPSTELRVHYVKLAYLPNVSSADEDGTKSIPFSADALERTLRDAHTDTAQCFERPSSSRCQAPFPQLPTAVQTLSPAHFDAYRNLGCRITLEHLMPRLNSTVKFQKSNQIAHLCLR